MEVMYDGTVGMLGSYTPYFNVVYMFQDYSL